MVCELPGLIYCSPTDTPQFYNELQFEIEFLNLKFEQRSRQTRHVSYQQ